MTGRAGVSAALLVLAVLVVAACAPAVVPATPAPTPPPAASLPAPVPTPVGGGTPAPVILPATGNDPLAGQPIRTVTEALAWHAANPDAAGTIIVRGWWGSVLTSGGPYVGEVDPLQAFYPNWYLMAEPEQLTQSTGNMTESHSPEGAFIAARDLGGTGFNGFVLMRFDSQPPVSVTVAGHFNDPESILCTADARAMCRDRFVIDAAFDDQGRLVPPFQTLADTPAKLTPDQARAAAMQAREGRTPLATTFLTSPDAGGSNPEIRVNIFGWAAKSTNGWLVRLVSVGGSAPPLTVLVDDETGAAHDLPAYPAEWTTAQAGLTGADRVTESEATALPCGDNRMTTGGLFVRRNGSKDLLVAGPNGTTTLLGSTSVPLFVRGYGFDTVVLRGDGTPLERGMHPFMTVCPALPDGGANRAIFQSIGMPGG